MIKRFPSLFSNDFGSFFDDFDSLMDNMFSSHADIINQNTGLGRCVKNSPQGWYYSFNGLPKGDEFVDKDGNLVIEMALAGYGKEQLKVSAEDGKLVISADKCETEEPSRSLSRRAFRKEFSDPAHRWDLENTSASYENGLLRVIVPPAQKKVIDAKLIEIK